MKKLLVAIALVAISSAAQAAIYNSPHDLSRGYTAAGLGSTPGTTNLGSCQFCHAPHLWTTSSIGANIPLWNKAASSAASYTLYTSVNIQSQTLTLGNGSKICLTCHDGSTAMGNVVNGTSEAGVGQMNAGSYANVTTDLTNDHPVGISYNTARSLRAVDTATSSVNGMKVFALGAGTYSVECASCHDPHGAFDGGRGGTGNFLRAPTGGYDKCTACHSK